MLVPILFSEISSSEAFLAKRCEQFLGNPLGG
jgi:hypothetical protein